MGINEFAGRIGQVIKHEIEKAVEIIAETRKGYNQKGVLYNSSGEDSPPVENDKIVILKVDGSGKGVIVGVFNETQGAKPGEKIYFARNEKGEIKSKLSMLGKGEVLWELQDFFELLTEKTIKLEAKEKIGIKSEGNFDIEAEKGVAVKSADNFDIEAKKGVTVKSADNVDIESGKKATVKGADVELNGKVAATGGSFKCAGTVAPTGSGALCGCKFCFANGAPIAGDTAQGT